MTINLYLAEISYFLFSVAVVGGHLGFGLTENIQSPNWHHKSTQHPIKPITRHQHHNNRYITCWDKLVFLFSATIIGGHLGFLPTESIQLPNWHQIPTQHPIKPIIRHQNHDNRPIHYRDKLLSVFGSRDWRPSWICTHGKHSTA